MTYPAVAHRREVSEAVRQLRATLGLTQQAFAGMLKTALTTIARWETVRSPRGRTLNVLARLAEKSGRADLAAVFRKELMAELGLALRSQFRYAVKHQRQAASGAAALKSIVKELLRSVEIFDQPNLTLQEAVRAGKEVGQVASQLEALVAAVDSHDLDSSHGGPISGKGRKRQNTVGRPGQKEEGTEE